MTFPIRIKPLNSELLTSWLARLAHENSISLTSLLDSIGLAKYAQEDFDLIESSGFFKALSNAVGVPRKELRSYQIRTWARMTGSVSQCTRKWVVPISHRHPRLRYCPLCLEERFYFRKEWRLAWLGGCAAHSVLLEEGCSHCGEGLQLGRVSWRDGLSSCWKCKRPFAPESTNALAWPDYFSMIGRAMSRLDSSTRRNKSAQWFDTAWTLANWIGKVHREGNSLPIDDGLGDHGLYEKWPEADSFYRAVVILDSGEDAVAEQIASHQFEFDRITYKKCPEGLRKFRRDHDWRRPNIREVKAAVDRFQKRGKAVTFYGIAKEINSTYETLRKYEELNGLLLDAMTDEAKNRLKVKGLRKRRQ